MPPPAATFGLAKSLLANTTGLTHTGTAIGTPHYTSPEHARGEKTIDPRAASTASAATLYELLTGATPYHTAPTRPPKVRR